MKSNIELGFWQGLYNEGKLKEVREKDYYDNFQYFPSWKKQKGKGLEVGSGLLSMLEFSGKDVISIDPLMDEYDKIYKHDGITRMNMDGENLDFEDETFDYAININVIDHTPDPDKMLSEIRRVLKPGGKLYFEVHFDKFLGGPHYMLWDREQVTKHFKDFQLIINCLVENGENQSKYYAEYTK